MMIDRRAILTLGALAACSTWVGGLGRAALAQTKTAVRIGTSSVGSIYYVIAVGLTKLLQDHAGISATAEPVGGSVANVFALQADKVDLAVTNAIAAAEGYTGAGRFKKPVDVRLLAVGQRSYRQFIVRVGSGIEKPADLKGKTIIGKRPALPEIEKLTLALLKAAGVDPSSVRIVATTETNEAVDALRAGTADAVVMPGGANASYIKQLARDGRIKFLDIPDDMAKAMLGPGPQSIGLAKLPAGMYDGLDKPVNVFDIPTYLVADARLPDDVGYNVVKSIFDHVEQFHSFHSAAKEWTLEGAVDDPKVPFHEGAVRYFKEKKVWTAEHDKQQAALLKRS